MCYVAVDTRQSFPFSLLISVPMSTLVDIFLDDKFWWILGKDPDIPDLVNHTVIILR